MMHADVSGLWMSEIVELAISLKAHGFATRYERKWNHKAQRYDNVLEWERVEVC